jgi:predicted Zn-dependent protease
MVGKCKMRRARRQLACAMAMAVMSLSAAVAAKPTITLSTAAQTKPWSNDERLLWIVRRLTQANASYCAAPNHCAERVILSPTPDLNAWADGRNILVSARMVRFASTDDELAFVVAHEMAHNLLRHAAGLQASASLFGSIDETVVDQARQFEIDADRQAITLLQHAGFDVTVPERFLDRSLRGRRGASHSHPKKSARIQALREAVRTAAVRAARVESEQFAGEAATSRKRSGAWRPSGSST